MTYETESQPESLIVEITLYLAVVDAFRAAGYEPRWRPESTAVAAAPVVLPAPPRRGPLRFDAGPH